MEQDLFARLQQMIPKKAGRSTEESKS